MASIMRRAAMALCAGMLMLAPASAGEYQQVDWPALIPEDANLPAPPEVDHNKPFAMPQSSNIELVEGLNGKKVKIPGFVVPLEGDEQTLTSFLLVPYFGACVHVPPPPPNQIVYVDFPSGAPIQALWEPIWIVGTMRTVPVQTELATVGYTLDGIGIEPYDESDWEEQPEIDDPWK